MITGGRVRESCSIRPCSRGVSAGGDGGCPQGETVGARHTSRVVSRLVFGKNNKTVFAAAVDNEPRSFEFGPVGSEFEGNLYVTQAYSITQYTSSGNASQFLNINAFGWDLGALKSVHETHTI